MNKNRKLMNALLVSTMMLTNIAPVAMAASEDPTVLRLGGSSRVETSVEVSDEAYTSAENVVIAGYNGEADALTGTLLAAAKKAPLLLVSDKADDIKKVKAELTRLGAKNVYLLGGENAISSNIESELSAYNVERVKGADRFGTAVKVAETAKGNNEHVLLANDGRSGSLADALAAGPVSGDRKMPVLLANKTEAPKATLDAMKELGVKKVTIVGGPAAIGKEVEKQLTDAGYTVDRVEGTTRWETAEKIATTYFENNDKVIIANDGRSTGKKEVYADALMGGYLGAKEYAPILLSVPGTLNETTKNYLGKGASFAYVLGGEAAISKSVFNEVKEALTVVEDLAVESVSAINSTTLEIKGAGLGQLEAADVTVEDNTVTSVTASSDGKTATVKLSKALLLDTDYDVKVKVEDETKSFVVKYALEAVKVEVADVTLDDDTIGQEVPVKINGQAADYDELATAGYTVQFTAVDSDGNNATATLFKNESSGVSNSPVVADAVTLDDYTVEVSLIKDGSVVVSDTATVKVRNLELTTSAIKEEKFTNDNAKVEVQNSRTLVTGDKITLTHMRLVNNGIESLVAYAPADMLMTSSNPAVISVNGDDLTANTPGTAKITFSYGDFEKEVTYTVTNDERKLNKVTTDPTSVTIIDGKNRDVEITAVDQFGDYITETITVEAPTNGIVTVSSAVTTTGGSADVTVTQDGSTYGSGVVLLKNAAGKTVGSFRVKTTAVDNVQTKKFEIVEYPLDPKFSDDLKLDMAGDDKVQLAYNQYTSEGVFNGRFDLNTGGSEYTVTYNADIVALASNETAGKSDTWTDASTGQVTKKDIPTESLGFEAVGVGSTDVVIYDDAGAKVHQFKITVQNTEFAIGSVNFKPQAEIDYAGKEFTVEDFLALVKSDNDDIVKGIALNKPTDHVIRVESDGTLYIDANGDGDKDVGEKELGSLVISTVSGGTGGVFASAADHGLFTGDTMPAPAITTSGNKGTLVFKVLDNAGKIIDSTSVNVDVK